MSVSELLARVFLVEEVDSVITKDSTQKDWLLISSPKLWEQAEQRLVPKYSARRGLSRASSPL